MHNISKAQNRLFNIILRIDNCLRHTFTHLTHTPSLSLHSFCVFLQAIPLSPQQQQLIREGTPKTNDNDNKNAAQKEARPVSRVVYVCGCVCECVRLY